MENAAIIGAVKVLRSALANELAALAISQTPELLSVLSDLDTSMNTINSELQVMQAFIEQPERADKYRSKAELVWLREVENIANHIEDTVDEFLYLVDNENYGGTMFYVKRIFKDHKLLCDLKRVASQLQGIERKVKHIAKIKDRWVSTTDAGFIMSSHRSNQYAQHIAISNDLIDREVCVENEDNNEVLSSYLNSEDAFLCKILVWGRVGVGKTRLVTNVFKREREKFDLTIWISISESDNTKNVVRKIIDEVCGKVHNHCIDTSNMELKIMKEFLRALLKDKKFLMVLDGFWHPEMFPDISDVFFDNYQYSRIVITTRMAEVANLAPESNRLELKPLSKKESWNLFCTKAFHLENNHECPPILEESAREIVYKCDGLPLALIFLAGLLSSVDKTESEWRRVYDQLSWELENNPTLDPLKNIFILSFRYLPNYLKNCLLYCCLFPDDSLLARKKLLRLWIAEGFIEPKGRSTLEEVAEGYFNELIHRSMLQVLLDSTYRTFQSLAGVTLPKGIFYLEELQTVQALESNALTMRELGNLTRLRSFRILNVEENHSAELCRSLSNMRSLSYLSIFASNEDFYLQLEDIKSLPQLQKLCLFGRLKEQMLQSPLFQNSGEGGEGIQVLKLGWSQLQTDPVPSLSHLKNLAWLTLQKAYEGKKLHFKAGWFPKLKHLLLRQMPNLVQVEMEQGTMVSLDTIHLLELEQLEDIPEGIKHLPKLRWMVCKYMPAGFADLPYGIHQLHHFRSQVL